MKTYRQALEKRQLAASTIDRYCKDLAQFLDWWKGFPNDAQSTDILDYVQYLQNQNLSATRINSHLNSLRQYYSLVVQTHNPVGSIYLKNKRANVLENVLDYKELEQLYQNYPTSDDRHYRNKIILGLLIYQGLTNQDLHQLKIENIDLNQGKIHVPPSRRANGRTLEINVTQLLDLRHYIYKIRPSLLENMTTKQAGRKTAIIDNVVYEQLFFSRTGSIQIKNSLKHLFIYLKKRHLKIINAKQIRASVLAHWLREIDVRRVQYMAGHRYVSSTEQYDLYRYEALKNSLLEFHPLADKPP